MNIVKKIIFMCQLLCATGLAYAADDKNYVFNCQCELVSTTLQEQGHLLHLKEFPTDLINFVILYLTQEELLRLNLWSINEISGGVITFNNALPLFPFSVLKGLRYDASTNNLQAAYWMLQAQLLKQEYGDNFKEDNPECWYVTNINLTVGHHNQVSCSGFPMRKIMNKQYRDLTLKQFNDGLLEAQIQTKTYQGQIFQTGPFDDVTLPDEGVIIGLMKPSGLQSSQDILAVYETIISEDIYDVASRPLVYKKSITTPTLYAIVPSTPPRLDIVVIDWSSATKKRDWHSTKKSINQEKSSDLLTRLASGVAAIGRNAKKGTALTSHLWSKSMSSPVAYQPSFQQPVLSNAALSNKRHNKNTRNTLLAVALAAGPCVAVKLLTK